MKTPLKTMTVTDPFGVVRSSGSGLPDSKGVRRHIGVDLRAGIGTEVYAVEDGVVTLVDDVGLKLVEIRMGDKLWRFLHLSRNTLSVGQRVTAGQRIGYSGDTGGVAAHLHIDARKAGTAWNASFSNYFDPMILLTKGDNVTRAQADKIALNARLLQFKSVAEANAFNASDAPYIMANPDNIGKLLEDIKNSPEWQDANKKKVAFEKGQTEGTKLGPGKYYVS